VRIRGAGDHAKSGARTSAAALNAAHPVETGALWRTPAQPADLGQSRWSTRWANAGFLRPAEDVSGQPGPRLGHLRPGRSACLLIRRSADCLTLRIEASAGRSCSHCRAGTVLRHDAGVPELSARIPASSESRPLSTSPFAPVRCRFRCLCGWFHVPRTRRSGTRTVPYIPTSLRRELDGHLGPTEGCLADITAL
jgi:hypothetical protein